MFVARYDMISPVTGTTTFARCARCMTLTHNDENRPRQRISTTELVHGVSNIRKCIIIVCPWNTNVMAECNLTFRKFGFIAVGCM